MFERIRPDGKVIEIRGTPVPGGGFITTYVDMTARRAAEKLLSDSERRAREKSAALQITLAHMSQGLTMFDADGRLMVWNDRFVDMYGLPADGDDPRRQLCRHPEVLPAAPHLRERRRRLRRRAAAGDRPGPHLHRHLAPQ